MNKGIAIAGNLIVDYIKYIEKYPAEQTLTTITGVERSTGGLCCNCVLTLAKLDPHLPIKAIGVVGEDELGDYLIKELDIHLSVDISRILRKGATSYTDVMTDCGNSKRTFFHFRGSNALLSPGNFDFDVLDADILHIGYILLLDSLDAPDNEYPTSICRVLDAAQKAGIKTSIDVVSEDGSRFTTIVPPALQYVDYCCINEHEASGITGIPLRNEDGIVIEGNLKTACDELLNMGVCRWAIIHMPELSCGIEREGMFHRADSWRIPDGFKLSSVGAGDAYCSGILYGAYNGWSLTESMHVAGAVAAYSLSGAGAASVIKPLDEILDEMKSYQ